MAFDRDSIELAIILGRLRPGVAPGIVLSDVANMRAIARRQTHRATELANGETDSLTYQHSIVRDSRRAAEIMAPYCDPVHLNDEPRGFGIELTLPGGESNSFAGQVWGIS